MTTLPQTKYDKVAMFLHWVGAILMIIMLFFGEDMMKVKGATNANGPSLHVTLGVTILILAVLRLLWRFANPPPPLPADMKKWEVLLSKAVHLLFYILLFAIPLTGWLAFPHEVAEYPILEQTKVFGTFPVIQAPAVSFPAGNMHGVLTKIAIVLLALHVLAALKHQFVNRDGLLGRMLPW